MNEYKINITEVSKKQIIVEAESPNKALDIIQKKYMKSNMKEFKDKNLYEVDAKIVEENGEIIEENQEKYDYDKENTENHTGLEAIDARLDRMEDVLIRMIKLQKYIDEKIEYIENFAENAVELLENLSEEFEETFDLLDEEND